MITLSPEREAALLDEAKSDLVAHLIATRGASLVLLEEFEVAALLKSDPRTWEKNLPRVVIAPGVHRWQLSDILEFIERRKEAVA